MTRENTSKAERKTRISAKVREAVRLMVEEGLNRSSAAERTGLRDNSLYVALRRADVLAYRSELMQVLRTSEASRVIKRVADIADTAPSAAVRLDANQWLADVADEGPIRRGEVVHRHEGAALGLIVVRGGWQPHELPASSVPVIDVTPQIKCIGTPVRHPEERVLPSEGRGQRG